MNKIVAYTIVGHAKMESIITAVNEKIKEGWQPYGSLIDFDHTTYYYQPMVKYEENI